MSSATFTFAGAEVVATVSGALHVPAERTMIVADLHLEKASSLAQRGVLLPPYDSRATLAALARSMDRLKPRRVIYLGDSFHGPRGPERLAREDKEQIREWTATHEWIWIAGNHDAASGVELGGRVANEISMGSLVFRHQAAAGPVCGEISGHFHPKASIRVAGRRLTARCFVADGRRLILPAFGAYTGGLDVWDRTIQELLTPPFVAHLLGLRRVCAFPGARLAKT